MLLGHEISFFFIIVISMKLFFFFLYVNCLLQKSSTAHGKEQIQNRKVFNSWDMHHITLVLNIKTIRQGFST
jgi:hypothetical protein